MRVEFNVLELDELALGIFMGYGNDDFGDFSYYNNRIIII